MSTPRRKVGGGNDTTGHKKLQSDDEVLNAVKTKKKQGQCFSARHILLFSVVRPLKHSQFVRHAIDSLENTMAKKRPLE
ncbi:hypothetical protein JTE90_018252 [Oedothorax gibbosus]|uniref:Uncharacterized protein n=1 Tax=Oedothorax gibbosus TaxID=931172 RepID=A0AAV6U984_9ARAC|nr:hypothetical protein JTE90_018252 [Oedothorax gibbosus]